MKKLTTNQTKQLDWLKSLEKLQRDIQKSPEYKKRQLQKQKMKNFKKRNPLSSLFRKDPCEDCIVLAKCKKSYRDGSICERYIKAIQKLIKGVEKDARKRRRERRATTTKTS
jgi:hypothetical protein